MDKMESEKFKIIKSLQDFMLWSQLVLVSLSWS